MLVGENARHERQLLQVQNVRHKYWPRIERPRGAAVPAQVEGINSRAELAAAEGVQPPSMTRIANALEERGLVERSVVSDDRRSYRLRLTPRARRLIQTIRDQRTAWLADRVAELGPRTARDLERGIAALEQLAGSSG